MPFLHDLRDLASWLLESATPAVEASCAAIVRRLVERDLRTVGLAPADDDVAVPPVALQLARALALTSGGRIGVVDAAGTWTGPSAGGIGGVTTRWLLDDLAVLSPPPIRSGGAVAQLREIAGKEGAAFDRLIVDLTGLEHAGEQLEACAALDGTAIVARRGRTRARALRRWAELSPPGALGVLLTGVP